MKGLRSLVIAGVLAALALSASTASAAPLINVNLGIAQLTVPASGGGGIHTTPQPPPPPTGSHSTSCHAQATFPFIGTYGMQLTATDQATTGHFRGPLATGTAANDPNTIPLVNGFANAEVVSVDWGDGTFEYAPTQNVSLLRTSATTFEIDGKHTYVSGGLHRVVVEAAGNTPAAGWGADCSVAFNMNTTAGVIGQPVSFTVPSGSEYSGPVATFTDDAPSVASNYSATIVWGDGTSSVGVVTPNGGDSNRAAFNVEGTHLYPPSPNSYVVGVTIIDRNHGSTFVKSSAGVLSSG